MRLNKVGIRHRIDKIKGSIKYRFKLCLQSESESVDDGGQISKGVNDSPVIAEKESQTPKNNTNTVAHIKTTNDEKQTKYGSTGGSKTWKDADVSVFIEDESMSGFSDNKRNTEIRC